MARSLTIYTTTKKPSKDGLFKFEPLDFVADFDQFWELEQYIAQITHTQKDADDTLRAYLGLDTASALVRKYTSLLSEVLPNLTYDVAKHQLHNLGLLSVVVKRMCIGDVLVFVAEE